VTKLKRFLSSVLLWLAINASLLAALLGYHLSSCPKPAWWNDTYALATNILAGGLVSFFFYWLVVYVPEARKKAIIKNNLIKMYRSLKRSILYQVVFASRKGGREDLHADTEMMERLMTTEGFRAAFEGGKQGDEGFYAFINQMTHDTPEYREIVSTLELLAKQIEFVLHNYNMDDEDLFAYFKRLEVLLFSLRNTEPGYDESEPLCSFIYKMFSGWDMIDGYLGHDPIESSIARI
jgi:hypothetical protein